MGDFLGIDWKRVGLGVATGGLSEVGRATGLTDAIKPPKKPPIETYDVSLGPAVAADNVQHFAAGLQAPIATAPTAQAAQIGQGQTNNARFLGQVSRGYGVQATDLLHDAATGAAPSAAQAQLQQGTDAAMHSQLALANAARGGAAASAQALRGAAQGQAQLLGANANNAAMLRANEMAQARGQFADQSNAMRSGDLQQFGAEGQLAGQQAQLNQQAGLANQQAGLQAQVSNQQAGLGVMGLQANANQQQATDLLDMERLKMDAMYGPQAIKAGMYQADSARKGQALGGFLNAGGAAIGMAG